MKIVVVVDCQNDFITGSLGTPEAQTMIPRLIDKINHSSDDTYFIFTKDTHYENYLKTAEGKKLPIEHCIKNTEGWEIPIELTEHFVNSPLVIEKQTFGSYALIKKIEEIIEANENDKLEEIELCGLVSDICVVTNALILKTSFPECDIVVNSKCCAGTTPEAHEAALAVMRSCQIEVV